MTSRDFCFWLQGALEVAPPANGLSAEQLEMVKRHLALVFIHEIDPSAPASQQEQLNKTHGSPIVGPRPPGSTLLRC